MADLQDSIGANLACQAIASRFADDLPQFSAGRPPERHQPCADAPARRFRPWWRLILGLGLLVGFLGGSGKGYAWPSG